jgi:hypothetical protein
MVKMVAQKTIEPLRPMLSEVKACERAPTKVPAERREVMMDCRDESSVYVPSPLDVPKRRTKSGMMRQPDMTCEYGVSFW